MTIKLTTDLIDRRVSALGTADIRAVEGSVYLGAIHWQGAPALLVELVTWDTDLAAVRVATWARLEQGPGRPKTTEDEA